MRLILIAFMAVVLPGCDLPQDPEGTTERIQGGTLRAGVSENEPWTRWTGDKPTGVEVQLLIQFARLQRAEIRWVKGAESQLLEALRQGELDVVAGGLDDSTPWSHKIAMTQPFIDIGGKKHVLAVRQGENRWLLGLDRFLQSRSREIPQLLAAERGQ